MNLAEPKRGRRNRLIAIGSGAITVVAIVLAFASDISASNGIG